MYPTCILGAFFALLLPSIFTTTIPVEKAFTSLIAYQFFIYHAMLLTLGIIIGKSDEVIWNKKHLFSTLMMIGLFGFISLYVNSIMATPTYLNGKLISVDFWTNFFFTYNNPIGLNITTKTAWMSYLFVICILTVVLVGLLYLPLIFRNKTK